MNVLKTIALTASTLVFGGFNVAAQSHYEYKFLFTGMAYQTNASGNIVGIPITDQTLLEDRARRGNITDFSTVSIVYHINGNPLGDTVEIIANTNGQVLTSQFGLYYGSDNTLGRTAVTNAAQTQQRRVDFIYTANNSTYTFDNTHSVGLAITSKSVAVANGITNAVISGTMSWGVAPQGTNGPIVCKGNFSLGQPLF